MRWPCVNMRLGVYHVRGEIHARDRPCNRANRKYSSGYERPPFYARGFLVGTGTSRKPTILRRSLMRGLWYQAVVEVVANNHGSTLRRANLPRGPAAQALCFRGSFPPIFLSLAPGEIGGNSPAPPSSRCSVFTSVEIVSFAFASMDWRRPARRRAGRSAPDRAESRAVRRAGRGARSRGAWACPVVKASFHSPQPKSKFRCMRTGVLADGMSRVAVMRHRRCGLVNSTAAYPTAARRS